MTRSLSSAITVSTGMPVVDRHTLVNSSVHLGVVEHRGVHIVAVELAINYMYTHTHDMYISH